MIGVVGGGFWGRAVAVRLGEAGVECRVFDDAAPSGASRNAAGICKLSWYRQETVRKMIDGVFTYAEFLRGFSWLADRVPASLSPRARRGLVPVCGMIASGLVFEVGLVTANSQLTLAAFAVAAALIWACEGAFWTTVVELRDPGGARLRVAEIPHGVEGSRHRARVVDPRTLILVTGRRALAIDRGGVVGTLCELRD